MATIDLTRSIFEPRKRYSGVRMQQGRVVLDDDHNEAADQAFEATRRALRDVVGPSGSPDSGFKISDFSISSGLVDFQIQAGTMYVGGIPVTLEEQCALSAQTDWVGMVEDDRLHSSGDYELVYLEVWRQPVTAAEDREIADVALGGPDTAVRMRTMARVRRMATDRSTCSEAWDEVTTALETALTGTWNPDTCELENDLTLKVDFEDDGTPEDLCSPSTLDGYLGAENQAIRVQLLYNEGGLGDGELTWGFDNGAPLYRASISSEGRDKLVFDTLPRDEAHWPLLGQVVEVLPWSAVLVTGATSGVSGEVLADGGGHAGPSSDSAMVSQGAGVICKLSSSYDPTNATITLDTALPSDFNSLADAFAGGIVTDRFSEDRTSMVFVRVWNRGSDTSSDARISWSHTTALTLGNTGLTVQISGTMYNADAWWVIGARPDSPDRVYPWQLDQGGRPNGRRRYLTPLALIDVSTLEVQDCRETFRPLTRMKSCCRYVVGDGESTHGDFTSIQDAIDNLPASGGEICVLPGTYGEVVEIDGRSDITIHGCGPSSLIYVEDPAEAVLTIRDSQKIKIESLAIATLTGTGVLIEKNTGTLSDVTLTELSVKVRDGSAVYADDVKKLKIKSCTLAAARLAAMPTDIETRGRLPLIYAYGADIRIYQNRLTAEDDTSSPALRVAGGIQIAGGSIDVAILENDIVGGNGNGITLGHVDAETSTGTFRWLPNWSWSDSCLHMGWGGFDGSGTVPTGLTLLSGGDVVDIRIRRNRITRMASDGIGVAWFFAKTSSGAISPPAFITASQIRITNNRIDFCNTAERSEVDTLLEGWYAHGPIALGDVEDGLIRDNEVRGCGTNNTDPIVGIFVLRAEGVMIERNRVTHNGSQIADGIGMCGGIVVPTGGPCYPDDVTWDGRPSVRIKGNQILTHAGPAVWVGVALGTVEVIGNNMTTTTDALFDEDGSLMKVTNGGMFFEDFSTEPPASLSSSSDSGGQIIVHDNTMTFQPPAGGTTGGSSIVYLMTMDDIDCKDNNCRSDLNGAFYYIGWYIEGSTVHVTNNRVRETPLRVKWSIYSMAHQLTNETLANMCTHCVKAFEELSDVTSGLHNRSISDRDRSDWCTGSLLPGPALWVGGFPHSSLLGHVYTVPGATPVRRP